MYLGARHFGPRYWAPHYFGTDAEIPEGNGAYFGNRHFGPRYFSPRYFGTSAAEAGVLADVVAAEFLLTGSDIGLLAPIVDGATGGWRAYFEWEQRELERRAKRERELRELQEEADRLEDHLVATGSLPKQDLSAEVRRIKGLVEQYRVEAEQMLSNRARRAFDYAERVRTEAAYRLALRELERLHQEEELALMLVLTLD